MASEQLIQSLQHVLADMFTELHSLKHRHWHVQGIVFRDVHLMFDEVTNEVVEMIDNIGEYLVSFGVIAVTNQADILKMADIPVPDVTDRSPVSLLQNALDAMFELKEDLVMVDDLANECKEMGVSNLVEDQITHIDKFIYKYQAFLSKF